MITVEEARTIIRGHVWHTPDELIDLEHSLGRVLSEDVIAQHAYPLFDMSAVDGYALGDPQGPWKLVGRIPAGDVHGRPLFKGECVRIFTGAQVPAGSHCVVMQEQCKLQDNGLHLDDAVPAAGANIRREAEGFKSGDTLLPKGTRLDLAAVGLLASDGMGTVRVSMPPAVSIICTGNEFMRIASVEPGRIFSSNDRLLTAALRSAGCAVEEQPFHAIDTINEIHDAVFGASLESHLIITTGGVSVGEHDLVRAALEKLGAKIHFHGVMQKPGKPMLFATVGNVPLFALPGNPRAVLVAWYEYVLPFIRAMQGEDGPEFRIDHLPLAKAITLKGARAEFRPAAVRNGEVHLLRDEGSHMLGSLVGADALAYFPHTMRGGERGDTVEVHYLPGR
jgi:molybdopterin molybdotransferase